MTGSGGNAASVASGGRPNFQLDADLRGYLRTNADAVTVIRKPVKEKYVGALSAKSERPILFENIIEHPEFRVLDILLKHRDLQARALGVAEDDYLKTLAYRLRQPARGFKRIKTGPVKEVVITGKDVDLAALPILRHAGESAPALGTMVFLRDPDTGFHNTMHCYTTVTGRKTGTGLFLTPHCLEILQKYMDRGAEEMPIAYVIGLPPACEIMANFSGMHMDVWGEADMFGTIMDQDFETVRCETIDMEVPAHAEMVLEGVVRLNQRELQSGGPTPLMYRIPRESLQPVIEFTARLFAYQSDLCHQAAHFKAADFNAFFIQHRFDGTATSRTTTQLECLIHFRSQDHSLNINPLTPVPVGVITRSTNFKCFARC